MYDAIIYTHIPKCGGTSMRHYLNQLCSLNKVPTFRRYIPGYNGKSTNGNYYSLNPYQKSIFIWRKYKVVAMHVHYDFHKRQMPYCTKPFYMTIVREPLERLLSHYFFFNYTNGLLDCKGLHINQLSEDKLTAVLSSMNNVMVRYFLNSYHPANQSIGRKELKTAIKNARKYQFIGFLDTIENDIDKLDILLPNWIKQYTRFPTKNTTTIGQINKEPIRPEILARIEKTIELDKILYEEIKEHRR